MDSLYGDNTPGSEKEKDSGSETETVPDKVEAPGVPDSEEETPSPVIREKVRRKRNGLQEYPGHLFDNNVVRERRQTYVSSDNYERVRTCFRDRADSQYLVLHRQYTHGPSGAIP